MNLKRFIPGFGRREEGNATVEFVIVFPIIIILFIAAFETSMLLVRQVMLERSLDSSVRYLRITAGASATHDQIRENICENTPVIPNCDSALLIDLRVIDQDTYSLPDYHSECIDRAGVVTPSNFFAAGQGAAHSEQFMLIRACVVVDRILPFSGWGLNLTRDDTGGVHLTTATIFVNEPTTGTGGS